MISNNGMETFLIPRSATRSVKTRDKLDNVSKLNSNRFLLFYCFLISSPIGKNEQSIIIDTYHNHYQLAGKNEMAQEKLSSYAGNKEKQHNGLCHRGVELEDQGWCFHYSSRQVKFLILDFGTVTRDKIGKNNHMNGMEWN